jgi:hypothetical protein
MVWIEAGTLHIPTDRYASTTTIGMDDPAGAAAHVRQTLHQNGTRMIVEPRAGNSLAQNLTAMENLPAGRGASDSGRAVPVSDPFSGPDRWR